MAPKTSVCLLLLLLAATSLSGASLNLSGTFTSDDNVVLIPFSVSLTGLVTIQTTSFAGGSLGFEPVLTVYDGLGNLLLQDATGGTVPGGCGGRSIDAVSGFCLDAMIQSILNAGSYTLALTEWDNVPGGPTLADGFPQTGNGNFTGPEFLGGPGSFVLFNGAQRNGNWALSATGVDLPEPATFGAAGFGLLALVAAHRRSSQRRSSRRRT